ncbi:hypothetical protein Rt10032_c01g0381 [Rhodotorula toruloides]|uniref:Uncharacterized protein n=1 Tax=Rhodotorula toruloides TaxID=5286 RepID=A0A511KA80_RHOTO|nr:hypothetical protein Rt10032_c01g0381 [Rhodotorula toruloides]
MSYPTSSWRPQQADSYAYPPAQPPSYAPYPPTSSVPPACAAPQNPHPNPMSHPPPPPRQHYHSQSASSPRCFGGFGSRVMGTSAPLLPPLDAPGPSPYSQRVPYPPSPVSPSYPGGMVGQMSSSVSSYITSGHGEGHYHSGPPPPPETYMFFNCPPNVSMQPPLAQPRTPPPSAGRKGRVPSAQASFANHQPMTQSSNSRPPSSYGGQQSSHWYLTRPEEGNYEQQASSNDLDKFVQEMTEVIGPEGIAAISASPSFRQQQQQQQFEPQLLPSRPSHSSSKPNSRPTSSKSEAKYNVSGVLLTEEEYRALADSPSLARRKLSVRTFAPTQSLEDAFPYGVNPSSTSERPQSAYLDFPVDLQRPASAPPTPAFEPEAIFQFTTYGSSGNSPPRGSVPLSRRRGSSLDPSIPRSFGLSGLVGYAPSQEYSYAAPRAQTPPQQHPRRPSASMQGWSYPETRMSAPQRGYYAQPPPSSAYPSDPRQQLDPISPSPAPSSSRSAPTPSASSKLSGNRRARSGNKSISFINFSAADSKTLLNGVAPSGSSKKRQRDDDDGRRDAKRMTEVEGRE